jgi:TolB protein
MPASWLFKAALPTVLGAGISLLLSYPLGLPGRSLAQETVEDVRNELVVYTTLQPYNLDIYLRDKRGESLKRLTSDQANEYNPTFSPDGRYVVFCSEHRGNPDLFAVDLVAGGPPRPLTSSPAMEDAPSISLDGKRIAFVSDRHGNADIFVMPFDPEAPQGDAKAVNLTSYSAGDFNPTFSPDGNRIAFSSDRHFPPSEPEFWRKERGGEIWVMDADGRNVRRLTYAEGWDGSPSWSPDGKTISFYSERDGSLRIWRMDPDGADQRPISPREAGSALTPAVAPEGRVAFSAEGKIYTLAPDGTGLREETAGSPDLSAPNFDLRSGRMVAHGEGPVEGRILREDGRPFAATGTIHTIRLPDRTLEVRGIYPSFPSLGPSGKEIAAAHSAGETGRRLLVVSKLDGSDPKTIFRAEGQIISTSWSPTGEWIAVAEGLPFAPDDVRVDIWRVRPDGRDIRKLTPSSSNDAFPDFSGDGKRIVFRSGRDGNKEIYLMEADGTQIRRLTRNRATDTMPSLSPDGAWVAFSSDEYALSGTSDFDIVLLQLDPSGRPGASAAGWLPGNTSIATTIGPDMHPRFSPDGAWIVFASARGGFNDEAPLFDAGPQPYGEIWASPFPGGPAVRLTHNKWEDSLPDWGQIK